jgi:hypothetical protein
MCDSARNSRQMGRLAYICDIAKWLSPNGLAQDAGLVFSAIFRVANDLVFASYRYKKTSGNSNRKLSD